ncbi:MAG: hypothetical protein IPQ07_23125 [Myxococcales bacterium]|nr:hypothetical protein [Myxococcales bacterium]
MTAWTFTQPPAPRQASVTLFVFGALTDDVPMSLSRFGVPDTAALELCDVRMHTRDADPRWFDGWRSGSLRNIAKIDLGDGAAVLDEATVLHSITAEISNPADLRYLQTAWALARYLVARGGSVVLDAHAIAFTAGASVPAAGAPLDVAHEVRIVYETESTRPDQAHAIHTRGMRKFGAPDLIALCSDADVPLIGTALGELADSVARGAELGSSRHKIEVLPGVNWVAVPDEHGLGNLLQLNNTARVIVDSEGHDLVGVAERLRRAPS